MLPPFLRGGVVVLSSDDDDAAASSEGTAVAVVEPSFLLSLDFGLSVASGGELEPVDSGSDDSGGDDDSDEDVVVAAGSVAAAVVVADGAVTVNVFIAEFLALYKLSPAKWL